MNKGLRPSVPLLPQKNPGDYSLLRLFNIWPDTDFGQYWQVQRVDPCKPDASSNRCVGHVGLTMEDAIKLGVQGLREQAAEILREADLLEARLK